MNLATVAPRGRLSRAQHAGFQLSTCPEIAALQIEIGPGLCCFCEAPLVPNTGRGRPKMNCGKACCRKAHMRCLNAMHWAARRSGGAR